MIVGDEQIEGERKKQKHKTLVSRGPGGRVQRLSGFDPVANWRKSSSGILSDRKRVASLSPLHVRYPGTWLALQSGLPGSPGIFQFRLLEWH